jgi:hypothetical protein
MPEIFPELLAASGLAACFVSEPYIWDQFIEWCLDKGLLLESEPPMSREMMMQASSAIHTVYRQVEIQFLAARIGESLKEK